MATTFERRTKIERIKNMFGRMIHVGDLVSTETCTGTPSQRTYEGEVVGIEAGRVIIDLGETTPDPFNGRFVFVFAHKVEVIVCKRD